MKNVATSRWGRSSIERSFQLHIICILCLSIFSACQPEATPVANVAPPTPTEDTVATVPPPIRYVLGTHAQDIQSIQSEIATSALLIPASSLNQDSLLGTDYEVIADYGFIEGWQQSPVVPTISLIINPNLEPLNDATITNIIQNGIDGARIVNQLNISGTRPLAISTIRISSLKTEFANMGYPDGFVLQVGVGEVPNHQAIITELDTLSIDSQLINHTLDEIAMQFTDNRLHIALVKWHSVEEKALWTSLVGEQNVIDLYQVPISYLTSPELKITFTDNGFPIASY